MSIVKKVDSLPALAELSYEQLVDMKGIGRSKACTLLASLELSRRMEREQTDIKHQKLTSSQMVYEYYRPRIGNKKQEYFYVVYLDTAKQIIGDKQLFVGTINYSVVHPREIFKEAYRVSASAIICCHNHPSGNVLPSREDIELTEKLEQVGEILGIKMLDHIIIGKHNYYSFLENKIQEEVR